MGHGNQDLVVEIVGALRRKWKSLKSGRVNDIRGEKLDCTRKDELDEQMST